MVYLDKMQNTSFNAFSQPTCEKTTHVKSTLYPKDRMVSMKGKENPKAPSSPFASSNIYVKYGAAIGLGIVPFVFSYAGIGIIQGVSRASLWVERNSKGMENNLGQYVTGFFRVACGVPALVGGALIFGGSKLFAKSQQLVWGKKLIENPIEEQTHTRLARYGLSKNLAKNFQDLISAFFDPAFLTKKTSGQKKLEPWTTFNPGKSLISA